MPFKQVFEKRVNVEMQADPTHEGQHEDVIKPQPDRDDDEEDAEMSEKKDRPPRFSTLFGVAPPLPAREFESYQVLKRKSGIWMPTALFVLLLVVLFFESTLLFAYTIIGLYNNLPARLVPAATPGCNCEAVQQPAVNIAPNFLLPQAQTGVVEAHTVTVTSLGSLPATLSTATSSTLTSSTSSSSTLDASSQAAAVASDVLGIFKTLTSAESTASSTMTTSRASSLTPDPGAATSTLLLSEVSPPRSTVNSVTLVTVNAAGSTIPPRSTVTSTTVIDASQATADKGVSGVTADGSSAPTDLAPPSSRLLTSTTPTSTPPATTPAPEPSTVASSDTSSVSTATSVASANGKICFGGSGAVQLSCVDE